jgi:thiamine biosynthesis lipoprotein
MRDGAVATSGTYERGTHIVDGRTGRPVRDLVSLTVIAPDLTTADATSTAAFAMGTDGIGWAHAQPDCLVFAIDAHHRVHRSAELNNALVPTNPSNRTIRLPVLPPHNDKAGTPGRPEVRVRAVN